MQLVRNSAGAREVGHRRTNRPGQQPQRRTTQDSEAAAKKYLRQRARVYEDRTSEGTRASERQQQRSRPRCRCSPRCARKQPQSSVKRTYKSICASSLVFPARFCDLRRWNGCSYLPQLGTVCTRLQFESKSNRVKGIAFHPRQPLLA